MPQIAESPVVRTKRDAQIIHYDLGGLHTYVVAKEAGDWNLDCPEEEINMFLDRGVISDIPDLRNGDESPMTFGYSAYLRDLGDTEASPTYATLPDICFRYKSKYVDSNWISTMATYSDAFTVGTSYTVDGSAFGEADKSIVLPHCKVRGSFAEGDPTAFTVTGTCFANRPTLV